MSEIYNGENKPVHPETGWRLASVWSGQQTTGDYTVGDELIAYYEAPGTPYTAEITYFVTGFAENEETGEREDCEPGDRFVSGGDYEDGWTARFGVDERFEFFNSPESRELCPDETSYEGGSYFDYETIKEANAEARRMALRDQSFAFAHPDVLDRAEAV